MTITIIGAGNVGMALAKSFSLKNKHVVIGVSNLAKYQEKIKPLGENVHLKTIANALIQPKLVILAVPYQAALEIASLLADWQNCVLIDVTTPALPDKSGLAIGFTSSGAEEIAKKAFNARVVKAFSTMSAESMENPIISGRKVFMPICGDDVEARAIVIELATLLGFEVLDAGELKIARYLEPLAMTWVQLALKQGYGRNIDFSLLWR